MRQEATGENLAFAQAGLPKPGDVLAGKYRIEKVVGEGGMGVVFAARHEALDQLVAIKVLLADAAKGDGVIERFVREAQSAARLQSEHVARVFDAGSLENNVPFLVMEYLEGCDLEELIKLNGALPITDACDYILQALAAMAQAHAVGIIHRDLKPANLFLAVRPDGSNVIKILDFGISKQTASSAREKALTGRAVLGSPAYMPPEQLRNAKGVDIRADIWSLGIVLYEMLAGNAPFDGEGVGEIFAAILEKDPPKIRDRRPEVPAALEQVVFRCLQRKAEDRWQTVGEFAAALEPFGSGKWAPLVETIESTLARSERLRINPTPFDMRLAALQARDNSPRAPATATLDELGPVPSSKVAFTRTDDLMPTARDGSENFASTKPRRSKTGILVAATALVIMSGAAVLMRGYLNPVVAKPVISARANPIDTTAQSPIVVAPAVSTPQISATDAGAKALATAVSAAPPRPAGAGRGGGGNDRRPKPQASTRPQFLNSRE